MDSTALGETDAPFTDICKGVPPSCDQDTCLVIYVLLDNALLATEE